MAAYMRKRRARLKAEAAAGGLLKPSRGPAKVIPLGRALTLRERHDDAEMEAIERRGGRPEWDVAGQKWIDAAAPGRVLAPPTVYRLPARPRSMIASGGTPPSPPVRAVAAEASAAWRANMQAMVAALAARSDAQERRIAALEAEAEARRTIEAKSVERGAIANAFFGLLGAAAAMLA
jgi:hypothetical protein